MKKEIKPQFLLHLLNVTYKINDSLRLLWVKDFIKF